jgi:hypothetical protein
MDSPPPRPPVDADELLAHLDDLLRESPTRLRDKVREIANTVIARGLAASVASGIVVEPASTVGSMTPPPSPPPSAHAATDVGTGPGQ